MLTAAILGDWSWTSVALGIGAILVGVYIPTLRTWIAGGLGKNKEAPAPVTTDFTPVVDRSDPSVTGDDLAQLEASINKRLGSLVENFNKAMSSLAAEIKESPSVITTDLDTADPRLKLSAALILLTDHCVETGDTDGVTHCEALAKTIIKQPTEKRDVT